MSSSEREYNNRANYYAKKNAKRLFTTSISYIFIINLYTIYPGNYYAIQINVLNINLGFMNIQ